MAMNLLTPTQGLHANKWYPIPTGNKREPYPSPQSILRASVGEKAYKFECKTVNTDHIRAACILPKSIPFTHLMATPWSLAYATDAWRMIIVSCQDFYTWIDLARASGAIAWQIGHAKTHTYQWEPPRLDRQGMEIRPPNTIANTLGRRSTFNSQYKDYDREAVLDLLREGQLSMTEIGAQHGISRITVQKIASRAGISQRKPHWGGVSVSS